MKSNKILLVVPLSPFANGGIASWAKKYIQTFDMGGLELLTVNISEKRSASLNATLFMRIYQGIIDLLLVYRRVKLLIKGNRDIIIMHTITSGSLGSFRDYILARVCRRNNIKTIMHCRYGNMTEVIKRNSFVGILLRKTLKIYDQIWVLDKRTLKTLQSYPRYNDKVFLTPNSIEVASNINLNPKNFFKIAFVANLFPTKGIYELVEAVVKINYKVELLIIGPGSDLVINNIKLIAGGFYNTRVKILGKLPNYEVVELMKKIDIVALPTYYPAEAFPMSILEAMSLGKLVISTNRAAIGDMLTGLNGNRCGIIVAEKSVKEIIQALNWCIENPSEANLLCEKAYEKVKKEYSTKIVYKNYENKK